MLFASRKFLFNNVFLTWLECVGRHADSFSSSYFHHLSNREMEFSALIGFWVSLAPQYRLTAQQQIYGSGFQRLGRWSLYYDRERPPFPHYLLPGRFYHRQAFNYDFNFGVRPKINQISIKRCSAAIIKYGDIHVPTKSCFRRVCICEKSC